MLIGDLKADFIRHNEKDSLWGVRRGSPQWSAWVNWYFSEFRKTYFPEWLTVLFEWPPTTASGADAVAQWLSDIRDSKYQKDPSNIGGDPVPRHPAPWNGAKSLPPSPPCSFPGMETA